MAKIVGFDFAGSVVARVQLGNARSVHVKANDGNPAPRKRYRYGQSDVTQSDDRNLAPVCHVCQSLKCLKWNSKPPKLFSCCSTTTAIAQQFKLPKDRHIGGHQRSDQACTIKTFHSQEA